MGSFPSQEQAVHPSTPTGPDPSVPQQHSQQLPSQPTRARTNHTLVKKFTRGRLLVLGLDGAGKSTIVANLVRSLDDEHTNVQSTSTGGDAADEPRYLREYPNPSKTCQTSTYRLESDYYLQVIDVPGRRDFRRRWYTTLLAPADATHYGSSLAGSSANAHAMALLGIVFVVDASDQVRFPIVADELIRYQKLKEHKKALKKTQLFLLLNKSDQVLASAPSLSTLSLRAPPSELESQKQELQAAHRVAMRAARRELKKCLDHQLRVDQRRNPRDYQRPSLVSVPTAPSGSISQLAPILPPGRPSSASKVQPSGRADASSADATGARTTVLMTSILECCAHDHESIKAIHGWIKDEIKKVQQTG
ncbi:hypothetical protein PybrP1_011126 [[Pythium] brassicae (nom. inval.)]|nr:hypothetical protein PybrP1_011126 [[Pythium] brassicae (nom. inval.)]